MIMEAVHLTIVCIQVRRCHNIQKGVKAHQQVLVKSEAESACSLFNSCL